MAPTPTPSASVPVKEKGLTILTQNGFTDGRGAAHVVGEVYNGASLNWMRVTVTCEFYDKDEHLLATRETYALIDILLPDEKAPFKVSFWEPAAEVESFVLSVSGQETTRQAFTGIEFAQDDGKAIGDALLIFGEVINRSGGPANNVRIAATIFDREDRIIDVGFAYAERDIFVRGSVSPFALTIDEINGEPERYELIAYGERAQDNKLDRLADIELGSAYYPVDASDDPVLVGEVTNVGVRNATSIKVFASFYDREGTVIDTAWSYIWAAVLEPGARSPFNIAPLNPGPEIKEWTVWVEGIEINDPVPGSLVLQETTNAVSDDDVATFTGFVHNDGIKTMTAIEVAVTVYDGEGKVVAAGWEWLDGDLEPGARMPFTLEVEASENANSYELYVQGTIKT
jgi:hypothetical protein